MVDKENFVNRVEERKQLKEWLDSGSVQTITRNKRMLTERDFIEKEGELYVFSDPVFELWFKREYC
ncbi:hypothetical protein K0F52_11490 [Bacteroides fragilis]|nr:hypothetical protein [Bacteroides fragilis]QTO27801.1 hypothetical protein G7Y45_00275 [Bacteroides sp. ZJ-18]MCE8571662.1 hypothetical protein [Bacteroides fragilis]MCE8642951.1 hypothetical protein [Bacteroides fragilis]MCE8645669.1 hypothetical protein [Bacteroides fragilis]